MSRPIPLVDRIEAALLAHPDQQMTYYDLARALWPPRSRAWQNATTGGPPGCYMALSAGIRRGEFGIYWPTRQSSNSDRIVTLGKRR